jgi:hypothetical protein
VKPKPGHLIRLSFTIDGSLCKDIDGEAARMTTALGIGVTRTEVIRLALRQWLESRQTVDAA